MIGLLATAVLFPAAGLAVSRLAGRMQPYLAGAGAVGTLLFLLGVAHVPFRIALALVVVAIAAVLVLRRGSVVSTRADGEGSPAGPAPVANAIMIALLAWLLFTTAIVPLDDYDGRAFWLLKAKAIVHDDAVDGAFFQQHESYSSRNQYPLLLPLDAAAVMLAGRELDDRQTRWLYALFAIALALEVRRRFGAWLGAAMLCLPEMLSPSFGAASAGSDVALGAFAAMAFFEIADGDSPLRAGIWLSFAALTKSEGLPLAIVLLVVAAFTFRKRVVVACVPAAVTIGALFLWRTRVPRSDENAFAGLILDLPRHSARFAHFLGDFALQTFAFATWGAFWIAVVVALCILVARREWRRAALAAAVIVPMILLYAAVVAVTDWEPAVMNDLAPRLLLHLIGPAVWAIAAAVRPHVPPAP